MFVDQNVDPAGEIYVMNADGAGLKRLTTSAGTDTDPSWSPDGRRIAFASGRGEPMAVWSMTASGAKLRRLTDLNLNVGRAGGRAGGRTVGRSERTGGIASLGGPTRLFLPGLTV